jgi:pyruvate-ferredoxin/flavodoxin oxidoreductase
MTDQEILELPKVWVVGGDGGMGDIGYQNTSKVILQNRPNVKALMLDTQVYSNTGGQNSDSTPMLGGNDMNVFGAATQGKNVEKKTVAETFLAGHGSPFIAQISIANAPKLYRAILDGIEYRGTAFLQCFTTCQPEHGVADDMALTQAQRVRDSRGASEFVFNPRLGETYQEALDLKGNPSMEKDWYETKFKATSEPYRYTVAHWCATEARFRNHLKKIKKEDAAKMVSLENILVRVTQQDVVYRRYLIPAHRSYIPDFGVYMKVQGPKGDVEYRSLSRQLVMFCVERGKAWRMLQSKAGIENKEYKAQRAILADVDAGKISREDFFAGAEELMKARLDIAAAEAPRPAAHPAPAAAAKTPAKAPETVSKSRESNEPTPAIPAPVVVAQMSAAVSETVTQSKEGETSEVVVAMAAQVTVVREAENESGDWEQSVQLRLMELDVDPGNDAGGSMSKRAGK